MNQLNIHNVTKVTIRDVQTSQIRGGHQYHMRKIIIENDQGRHFEIDLYAYTKADNLLTGNELVAKTPATEAA